MGNRRLAVLVTLAVLCLGLAACAKKEEEPRLAPLTQAEISGERLWRRITAESDWDTWSSWPGYEGVRPGQSPHGKLHEVYVNYVLIGALPATGRVAPEGSVIVKENFDSNRKEISVTVMAKVKGFDPEHDDWFWASYDPTGKVQAEGKVALCIDCHSGMKVNDYVIIRRLDSPLVGN
jgi:hypothetical protein